MRGRYLSTEKWQALEKKEKGGQRNNEEQMKITKELFNMRTKLCKCFVVIQNFVE